MKDDPILQEGNSDSRKLSQQQNKYPQMLYLLTQNYENHVKKYFRDLKDNMNFEIIKVNKYTGKDKQNNQREAQFSSFDQLMENTEVYLLKCSQQLENLKYIHGNLLAEQYRNQDENRGSQKNSTIQSWLKAYSKQIKVTKNTNQLGKQNNKRLTLNKDCEKENNQKQNQKEITFKQFQDLFSQNLINLNLLKALVCADFHEKKAELKKANQQLKYSIFKNKTIQQDFKKKFENPQNSRLNTMVKNLELRVQTIQEKKNVKSSFDQEQITDTKSIGIKKNKIINERQDYSGELERIQTVLKNGMWGCLDKIRQRISKLNELKRNNQEINNFTETINE